MRTRLTAAALGVALLGALLTLGTSSATAAVRARPTGVGGTTTLPTGASAGLRQAVRASLGPVGPRGWRTGRQTGELSAPDGYDVGFSVSVSANGSTAVVGAWGVDDAQGAAYVFVDHDGSWAEKAELTASDGESFDDLGYSVAISADGTTVVAGADNADRGQGAVYVFSDQGGPWVQTAKIPAPEAATALGFGYSVAADADVSAITVGAYLADGYPSEAYVYSDQDGTWAEVTKLVTTSGTPDSDFGTAVAMSADGSTAVVGAWKFGDDHGAAYVFADRGGRWVQAADFRSPSAGALFGWSVAISAQGSTIVIGCPGADTTGAAYVFSDRGGTWVPAADLIATDGKNGDELGSSVAISANGSTVAAGAYERDGGRGAVDVFTDEGSWRQRAELTASDGAHEDYFGWSAAMSANGSRVVAGAFQHEDDAGAAYIFAR